MTELAEVLEAIHQSRSRIRTVRAEGVRGTAKWRLWWDGPLRIRLDVEHDGELRVLVQDRTRWWASGPDRYDTNEGREDVELGFGPELEVLNTLPLLGESVLDLLGEEQIAGRRAALLRARWRGRVEGSELFWGSNEPFEVAIDVERGVLLRDRWSSVTEIAFDEAFANDVFSAPPRQVDVRDESPEPFPNWAPWDAHARVGFPVHMPSLLPEGARPLRCLLSGSEPPDWISLVWAIDPGFRYRLQVRQGPGLERDAKLQRWSLDAEHEPQAVGGAGGGTFAAVVRRAGNWFEVASDLPLDTVIEIAASIQVTS